MKHLLSPALGLILLTGCGPNTSGTGGPETTTRSSSTTAQGSETGSAAQSGGPGPAGTPGEKPAPADLHVDPLAVLRELNAKWQTDEAGRVVKLEHAGRGWLKSPEQKELLEGTSPNVREYRAKERAIKSLNDLVEVVVDEAFWLRALGDLPKLKRLTIRNASDYPLFLWLEDRKGLEYLHVQGISGGILDDYPVSLTAKQVDKLNNIAHVELGWRVDLEDYKVLRQATTLRAVHFDRLSLETLREVASAPGLESISVGRVLVTLQQAANGEILDEAVLDLSTFARYRNLKSLTIGEVKGTNSNKNFGADSIPIKLKGLDIERPVIKVGK